MPRWWVGWLIVIGLVGCDSSDEPPPIYLGHLAPSGDHHREYDGIALAVEQINGDPEQRPHGRRLIVFHGEVSEAKDYRSQAVRLAVANDVKAIIGAGFPEAVSELSQAALSEEILAIATSADGFDPVNPYFFPVGTTPAQRGTYLARFALDELKAKRPAVLIDRESAVSEEVVRAFREANSGVIALREFEVGEDKSLPAVAQRVISHEPDVVVLAALPSRATRVNGVLGEAGLMKEIPILYAGPESAQMALLAIPDLTEGWYLATPFAGDDPSERNAAFVKAFREKVGAVPDLAAAMAYDALNVYAQAARRTEEVTEETVFEQFRKGEPFEVLTGELRYTKAGEPRRAVIIGQIENGRLKTITKYQPDSSSDEQESEG